MGSGRECLTGTVARYLHAAGQKAERVLPIDDASKVTFAVAFLVLRSFWGTWDFGRRWIAPMEKLVPICRNNDFRRIYARGKSYVSPLVLVYALKNRTKNVRVGITTS